MPKFSRRATSPRLGSLFVLVSWSRPQPHIVQSIPFSPLARTCTSFPFLSEPALSCGNKLPPLVNTQCRRSHGSRSACSDAGSPFRSPNTELKIFTHKLSRSQAQRQGGPQGPTNATSEYEMSGLQNQDRITNGGRASSSDGMTRFYNQVRSRQNRLSIHVF